jgi:hypothetical protein
VVGFIDHSFTVTRNHNKLLLWTRSILTSLYSNLNYKWRNSESQSYVTTDGQSANLSWNKAPIWGLRPDSFTVRQLRVRWCEALSVTRGRVCSLQLLLPLASAVILGSESRGTHDHILLPQIRYFPFCRLLRLAGLRWRYSTPPPQGVDLILVWTASYSAPLSKEMFVDHSYPRKHIPLRVGFQESISTECVCQLVS